MRGILIQPNGRQMEVVEAFLGVPYAAPPTGTRRFRLPEAASSWSGVRLCDTFSAVCPQRVPDLRNRTALLERMPPGRVTQVERLVRFLGNQSENCLGLNIYVPGSGSRGEDAPYSILVWLHGESFEWNAGSAYDVSVLSSVGRIIVITLNYRLGVLGFMRTGPGMEGDGLLGLRDVEAALRWVKVNAAEFGGDPNRVTLLGHHTGAVIANLIMLSPQAKGLAQRVVLLSGSALSAWAVQLDAARAAASVARQVGCREAHLACLQRVPVDRLLAATLPTPSYLPRVGPPPPDLLLSGVDPERAMREKTAGLFMSVPVMLGFTTSESVHEISAHELQWGMEEDRRAQVLRTFVRNTFAWHVTEILAAVLNEYTDWSRAIQHPISLRDTALEAITDGQTVAPLLQVASMHAKRGASTFLYHFAYQAKDADYPQRIGSARGDDVSYFLGAPLVLPGSGGHIRLLYPHNFTRQDQTVAHMMLTLLANFVKSGNPNVPQRPTQEEDADKEKDGGRSRGNVQWEPYDVSSQAYLSIGSKLRMRSHYRAHRMATWLHLVPQLHKSGGDEVDSRHHTFNAIEEDLYAGEVREEPYLPRPPSRTSMDGMEGPGPGIECVLVNETAIASASTMNQQEEEAPSELLHRDTSTTPSSTSGSLFHMSWRMGILLTLGAGCLLLLLNILVFAAILYHRERRKAAKQKRAETRCSELQKAACCSSSSEQPPLPMTILASSPQQRKHPPPALKNPEAPRSRPPTKKRVQIQEISV